MQPVGNIVSLCSRHPIAIPLDRMSRHLYHRISFAGDDGAGGYWDNVQPIADEDLTGLLVARRFADVRQVGNWRDRPGAYTGGRMPYPFLCRADGTIDQCLEVGEYGPHAWRLSKTSTATAFVGDFTKAPPTGAQIETAIEWTVLWHAWGLAVKGHTDEPGGSRDPKKQCPGDLFPWKDIRYHAGRALRDRPMGRFDAEKKLLALNVVF